MSHPFDRRLTSLEAAGIIPVIRVVPPGLAADPVALDAWQRGQAAPGRPVLAVVTGVDRGEVALPGA